MTRVFYSSVKICKTFCSIFFDSNIVFLVCTGCPTAIVFYMIPFCGIPSMKNRKRLLVLYSAYFFFTRSRRCLDFCRIYGRDIFIFILSVYRFAMSGFNE